MRISLFWKLTLPTLGLMTPVGIIHFMNPMVHSLMTLWMLFWLLGFFWLLAAEFPDLSTRGFIFVAYSSFLGVGGRALFDEKLWVADAVMQLLLILGGGIGAGLMADYIIKHDKASTAD